MEDAVRCASSPHDFKLLVASEGRRATTMDDLGRVQRPDAEPEPELRSSAPPPGIAA
jgi:twitching motility protein PilT